MDNMLFFRGLVMGFSIAAPVGPIGVLCIRRTLDEGRLAGLLTGLGAATADAIYGCVAGFGLVLISTILTSQQMLLRTFGGLFLCFLGVRTFLAKPAKRAASVRKYGHAESYVSTFFLTLMNPMTILSFAGVFAGLGLVGGNLSSAVLLVSGIFLGSNTWWFFLSTAVNTFRGRLGTHNLEWVNRISGVIIMLFGASVLLAFA